ncbi:MalY/PatB family protein [Bacillus ndiopicus]|uniref:MalY/PatB family protein n=1 Tax=Bacillus ndiopicus TaxID=1347368 RepID=UPI0005A91B3A|nr:MalY/PatB family protein [Bacillus ndiopicus]
MSIFNAIVDRRKSRSYKWDRMEQIFNIEDASDILPMWIADMDFAAPKEVIEAIEERLKHPVFGYSYVCGGCKEAIVKWYERRHQWTIQPETILFHHGVVPAIASIIETFTEPNDKVAISTPVYPPFSNVPQNQGRELVLCDLVEVNGSYTYDFVQLEELFKQGVKLYILCNPHNPAGVVWSRAQLEELVALCIKYDVYLLADEIHADVILPGAKFIPTLTVAGSEQAKIISCIAPTKTFNLAGIQAAMMVVPNEDLRLQLEQNAAAHGKMDLNAFASAAVQAAYTYGDAWLDELIEYVATNMDYVMSELNELEGISVAKPEGTYLMWIDYRGTGLSEKEMMDRLLTIGKLALEPGTKYGEAGRGFLRINVACPFTTIEDGVARFKKALAN